MMKAVSILLGLMLVGGTCLIIVGVVFFVWWSIHISVKATVHERRTFRGNCLWCGYDLTGHMNVPGASGWMTDIKGRVRPTEHAMASAGDVVPPPVVGEVLLCPECGHDPRTSPYDGAKI
ncbi:MAG TPA: hypothetical protein VG711_05470 [Phycisphaerales bacterium]|nr:hypothetical protein [Phycisphaerales bacterium]